MSLKKMVIGMAIGFAAREGIGAVRRSGGLSGIKAKLSQAGSGSRSGGAGGLGSMLNSGGGLGGLLGGARGGTSGLLGGLAAMAGGSAMLNDGTSDSARATRVDQGIDDEGLAALMLRAMAQAVRADGRIDDDEYAALEEIMAEGDEADREALEAALAEPVDAAALARDVPQGQGAQVYAAALTAINPDHPAEVAYLDALADALSLPAAERRMLHDAQAKPL